MKTALATLLIAIIAIITLSCTNGQVPECKRPPLSLTVQQSYTNPAKKRINTIYLCVFPCKPFD